MTQDQIKAIAEEYAKWFMTHGAGKSAREELPNALAYEVLDMIATDAGDMLRWLNGRYCIVEREKVMKSYDAYVYFSKEHPKASERAKSKVVANALADLFGTSMFNQNEE